MTSSSSPGLALKQEGISYLGGHGIARRGRQHDARRSWAREHRAFWQRITSRPPEAAATETTEPRCLPLPVARNWCDLTFVAFDLADRYRTPVIILGDGLMGQVMEPVVFPDFVDLDSLPKKDWVLDGCKGREPRAIFSMILNVNVLHRHNLDLQKKYDEITAKEHAMGDPPHRRCGDGRGGLRHCGADCRKRH